MKVLIIHGPTLNLLGKRESGIYGKKSLEEINKGIRALASQLSIKVLMVQLTSE
ncbi:MAG: type II 3-dehydroquinate dehydratase, partial [Nitrospira sp.]|nr:type II 3-dehydroquinate dehydratase [Nitrospira sp.]